MSKPKAKPPGKPRSAATYEGEYDPALFIVPASDSKGHGSRLTTRFSIPMLREVQIIVSSRLFPFLDQGDVIRWCVREGLAALNDMQEIPNSVFGQSEAAAEIARAIIHHKQYEHTFAELEEAVQLLVRQGALSEIKRLYAQVRAKFEDMPEGYWRSHYLSQLALRYERFVNPRKAKQREEEVG